MTSNRARLLWFTEFAMGVVLPAIIFLPALFFAAIAVLTMLGMGVHSAATEGVHVAGAGLRVFTLFFAFFAFTFNAGCLGFAALTASFFFQPASARSKRLLIAGLLLGQLNALALIAALVIYGAPQFKLNDYLGPALFTIPLIVSLHRLSVVCRGLPPLWN